ncbi:urease accessory UreF family protein [Sulfitobacter sp. HNIBRBA3233]|uniref:urease accessory protein UreF n=1 Tax=Sulfitobacter marinivivus TaxID=3158558 RepID=UPI0032DF773B
MTTDATLILSQWLSPGYPLGSFAYSHGLETVIQRGTVATAAELESWLTDTLLHGSGLSDAILLRAAHASGAPDAVLAVDAIARAYAPSRERLMESLQQGQAFCTTTASIWPLEMPQLMHPVAVGHAAGLLALPVDLTTVMYLQSFAANLVSCAVRLVPLGQTEGQAVLRSLTRLCSDVAARSAERTLDDLGSFAFASDIAAMHHETLEHRIFRT